MPGEFTNTITRITGGGSGAAALAKLNKPLGEIEESLNVLSARISGISDKDSLIRHYAPLSDDVFVGALVYYNQEPGHCRFEPAVARLLGEPGSQGQSVEAPEARVEGMVISIDSAADGSRTVMGTLLCGGFHEDATAALNCLGSGAVAGMYYLSPARPGHAVGDPGPHLRQPALSYYGNGKLNLGVAYLAHDNHFHASFVAGDHWKTGPSDTGPAPSGFSQWYDTSEDSLAAGSGDLAKATTAVFLDGVLQPWNSGGFTVDGGRLWTRLKPSDIADKVTVFNHYPFAYGSPVVREVSAIGKGIGVTNANGRVTIRMGDYRTVAGENSAVALASLKGDTLMTTPVVTQINAGPGLFKTDRGNGVVELSASEQSGGMIDAYDVNHNGTNMTSDGVFLYFTFPSGRGASLSFSAPVSLDKETVAEAHAWLCGAGTGGGFQTDIYWVPLPDGAKMGDMPGKPAASGVISVPGVSGKMSYAESKFFVPVSGNGMLVALVKSPLADADVRLFRMGFRLVPGKEEQEVR